MNSIIMNSDVLVTANADGHVIVQSKKNSIFGYIRLEQVRTVFKDDWCTEKKLSALVRGTMIRLKRLEWVDGQVLPGKITILEQMKPFNKKSPERDLKVAGRTGIVCIKDYEPIYRNCFWTEDPNALDILIRHDNGEAISIALEQIKEEEKASL